MDELERDLELLLVHIDSIAENTQVVISKKPDGRLGLHFEPTILKNPRSWQNSQLRLKAPLEDKMDVRLPTGVFFVKCMDSNVEGDLKGFKKILEKVFSDVKKSQPWWKNPNNDSFFYFKSIAKMCNAENSPHRRALGYLLHILLLALLITPLTELGKLGIHGFFKSEINLDKYECHPMSHLPPKF